MSSMVRATALAVMLLTGTGTASRAQVRRQPAPQGLPAEDSTRVTLALAVGNVRFDEAKKGRCTHAPAASIYNTLAAMWSVEVEPSAGRSFSLTVWQPMRGDSTPQMNFALSGNRKMQRIATVKATTMVGKGSVRLTTRGAGGRFEITGTTGDGAAVKGYVDCEKFSPAIAEGGN